MKMKYIVVSGGEFNGDLPEVAPPLRGEKRGSLHFEVLYRYKRLTLLGVISGTGKGIVASSAGLLLQSKGFVVTTIKIDPYINIDSGTMSPLQ
jgi:hypothetical protein